MRALDSGSSDQHRHRFCPRSPACRHVSAGDRSPDHPFSFAPRGLLIKRPIPPRLAGGGSVGGRPTAILLAAGQESADDLRRRRLIFGDVSHVESPAHPENARSGGGAKDSHARQMGRRGGRYTDTLASEHSSARSPRPVRFHSFSHLFHFKLCSRHGWSNLSHACVYVYTGARALSMPFPSSELSIGARGFVGLAVARRVQLPRAISTNMPV